MKIYRIFFISILITIMAVGYVHQRVEILKEGYRLYENRDHIGWLVDQNSKLMYNLSRLESPSNLLASVGPEDIEFANQRNDVNSSYFLVYDDSQGNKTRTSLIGNFLDLFTVKAEAEPRR